jgi:hypothetical protein
MSQEPFFAGDPFMQRSMLNRETKNTTNQLEHNLIVLEICNNWESVKDLYLRIEEGEVDLVNQMEGIWIRFLSGNRIDFNQFENPDDFENKFMKSLV